MQPEKKENSFDKVLLSGVFVGIIITLLSLFYDIFFMERTSFPFSTLINVSSLIFGVNLLFLVVGPIYYVFLRLPKFGDILFIAVISLVTIVLLMKVQGVDRTNDAVLNGEFRQLLSGIVILAGAGAALLLPFLFHNKQFRKNVI